MPDVRRTRATLRSAEFGFLGVCVNTRVLTPRRWGEPFSAGVFDFSGFVSRPLRTSCWMVGNVLLVLLLAAGRLPTRVGGPNPGSWGHGRRRHRGDGLGPGNS